jgi:prepilin-type N-terminal cleavage/methylation domain-containing protein
MLDKNNALQQPRRARGLTLIELLVVLALLGILISVGGLALNSFLRQSRLNEAARAVGDLMKRVGDQATARSQRLSISSAALTANSMVIWSSDGVELGRAALPAGTTVRVSPNVPEIVFSARGLPQTQMTFTVERGGLSKEVYLLVTGLVVQR